MEYANIQDKKNLFLEGFTKLAEGAKYWLMSYAIAFLGFLAILVGGFGSLATIESASNFESALSAVGAALGAGILLLLISAIISLLGLVKLKNGAEALSDAERDLSKGATGAKLMLYSIYGLILSLLILLVGIVAVVAPGGGLVGLGLLGLGGLILVLSAIGIFIGFILFIIFLYNIPDMLSRKYELEVSNDFKTAAIMFAIGIILSIFASKAGVLASIFDIVGAYFLYKASLDSIRVIEKWTPKSEPEGSSSMEDFTL